MVALAVSAVEKCELVSTESLSIPEADGASPLRGPIDLSILSGDTVAIRGDSGSGKTTLLRCLALLDPRAVGRVRFQGKIVTNKAVPCYRRDVSYVAQTPARFPMSVQESFAYAERFRVESIPYDRDRAESLLERLCLTSDILGRNLEELSVGEVQRIALVRALLRNPIVLLLDEPSAPLDEKATVAMLELIAEWRAAATRAVVLVSHDLRVVKQLANRSITFVDGEVNSESSAQVAS